MLAVLLLGQFLVNVDTAIVNVAGPSVQDDLHPSGGALELVVSGYTLTYAVLLVTGARLGQARGHRRMFLLGLAAFTAASLACGLAPATDEVFKLSAPRPQRCLIEAVVSNTCPFVGQTIRESRFRNHYNAVVVAVAGRMRALPVHAPVLGVRQPRAREHVRGGEPVTAGQLDHGAPAGSITSTQVSASDWSRIRSSATPAGSASTRISRITRAKFSGVGGVFSK